MSLFFDNNDILEENKDNNYLELGERQNNFFPYYDDNFENRNDNNDQFFNDFQNSFTFENLIEPNCLTEDNKDDKFNGEFDLDDPKKSKTEISIFERTRDTTKDKDKKSKDKESKTIFNQEKHDEIFIKEEKTINDVSPNNTKKIFSITKEYERKNAKGRKSKYNLGGNGKHNKFSLDNIVRKVKTNLFEIILIFINLSITSDQKENKSKNSKKKEFLVKIDQEIIKTINVNENLELLESKLKDIFSNKTSKKYKHLGLDRNKKIIDEIYEQKIQKNTISILNKTFDQCLDHINGINYDEDLAGLELRYLNIFKDLRSRGNSEDYISEFKYMVKNFKSFYKNKKARKKKE
jgi:hypothetical protein